MSSTVQSYPTSPPRATPVSKVATQKSRPSSRNLPVTRLPEIGGHVSSNQATGRDGVGGGPRGELARLVVTSPCFGVPSFVLSRRDQENEQCRFGNERDKTRFELSTLKQTARFSGKSKLDHGMSYQVSSVLYFPLWPFLVSARRRMREQVLDSGRTDE